MRFPCTGSTIHFHVPVVAVILSLLSVLAWASEESVTILRDDSSSIAVLGLGGMGQAIVKCLVSSSSTAATTTPTLVVHAWNRGEAKRETVRDVAVVHDTAEAAVRASDVTLILIDDWEGTIKLILELHSKQAFTSTDMKKRKTLVLFSTYTPTDIQKLSDEMAEANVALHLVGGAIVGVPQTICSPQALILLSSGNDAATVPVSASLQPLGRIVSFPGNDVGLAALANMALILVITFGLAGQEIAHLTMQQYSAPTAFLDVYAPLAVDVGPAYTKMLLPLVSQTIVSREFDRASYVPVGTFRRVVQMHLNYMKSLGIAVDDTFLSSYLNSLNQVTNPKSGPAAWVEHALVARDEGRRRGDSGRTLTLVSLPHE